MPEEVVKFGSEYLELHLWSRRRQYMAFKEALGTGVMVHLQVNCEIFCCMCSEFVVFRTDVLVRRVMNYFESRI